MTRHIRFNAFDMNCVAHQSPGLWRHPADRSHRYTDLGYWTELARLLERGLFDGLFIADVLGTYDVYGGTDDAAALATLNHAIDAGVTFLDTADVYGEPRPGTTGPAGTNEELLAQVLKHRRDEVQLATKFGIVRDVHDPASTSAAAAGGDGSRRTGGR